MGKPCCPALGFLGYAPSGWCEWLGHWEKLALTWLHTEQLVLVFVAVLIGALNIIGTGGKRLCSQEYCNA